MIGPRAFPRRAALILLCGCIATSAQAASARRARGPDSLRVEIRTSEWAKGQRSEAEPRDSLVVTLHAGDALPPTGRNSTFTLGRVVGAERAWLRFPHSVATTSPAGGELAGEARDSILLTTAWRSLESRSGEGGTHFRLRVLPLKRPRRSRTEAPAEILVRARVPVGASEWDELVYATELTGLFQLQSVAPGKDSLESVGTSAPMTELVFLAKEIWKGAGVAVGDEVTTLNFPGDRRAESWALDAQTLPLHVGDLVVLRLSHGTTGVWSGRWRFDPFRGYFYVDSAARRMFHPNLYRATLDHERSRFDRSLWPLRHPYQGRLVGNVVHASTGEPARGVQVSLRDSTPVAVTDSLGRFELVGVPIGVERLRMTSPCGRASGIVEASDEFTDSLTVRVPFTAPPCGPVRSRLPKSARDPFEPPAPAPAGGTRLGKDGSH